MRPTTLASLTEYAAGRHPARRAVATAGGDACTFAELDARVARAAAWLARQGLQRGDRVTLWAPNDIDWVVAYYGVLRAGLVVNPLNFLLAPQEVAFAAADCGAKVLIAGAAKVDSVAALAGRGELRAVTTAAAVASTPEAALPPADVSPADLAAILYTSGTTGHPKGAMLSHRGLLLNAALTAQMHARSSADTVVTALPLPHVYGAAILNAGVLTGATLVVHAQFREAAILADVERHRATMLEGVPTMYHYLLAYPDLSRHDLSSLTRCTVGGQTMPLASMQEVERRLGCPLIELWGMTELGGLGTTHASLAPPRLGSIGVALPHMETRVVATDDGRRELACGEVGELCVRGPLVMAGYFGNPRATAETIDADGWLHTGDLAQKDADGYVSIVDRKKDMILTGGYNVYPAELERVIAAHPAVAMVAVGRVPDAAKGELAKAYVVLRAGATATAEDIV
ncbi:MAG: AMP-binding protein, partial [Steroidobacteraceae bacterium]|nr:AMP-binding protein [Steroidobacteraceae bacterium]